MKKKKPSLLLEELQPGPLTGKDVVWLARQIPSPIDCRPFGEVVRVTSPTWYLARHRAAIEFSRRAGESVDPLCVFAELEKQEG